MPNQILRSLSRKCAAKSNDFRGMNVLDDTGTVLMTIGDSTKPYLLRALAGACQGLRVTYK
jgi:L-asparaginase II